MPFRVLVEADQQAGVEDALHGEVEPQVVKTPGTDLGQVSSPKIRAPSDD